MPQGPDPFALEVIGELKRRLERRFGNRLAAVYLFGSRARGDHRPDSDADVAVFVRDDDRDEYYITRDVIEDGYDLLLERGLYIQPWVFAEEVLTYPDRSRLPGLENSVLREGVPV